MCKIKQMYTVVKKQKISLNKCSSLTEAQAAGFFTEVNMSTVLYSAFCMERGDGHYLLQMK